MLRSKDVSAPWAQVALYVDAELLHKPGPHVVRDEVERLFLHGTALDRVGGARISAGVPLKGALEQGRDRRFADCGRSDHKQYSLPYLKPVGAGGEVLDYALQLVLQAVYLAIEELVDWGSRGRLFNAGVRDGVVHKPVRKPRYLRVAGHEL